MENYPEATWLPYVGYPAMTWLAISMVGQGIHWVSDYPLSIALGYAFGKIVSHKKSLVHVFDSAATTTLAPVRFTNGTPGLELRIMW